VIILPNGYKIGRVVADINKLAVIVTDDTADNEQTRNETH